MAVHFDRAQLRQAERVLSVNVEVVSASSWVDYLLAFGTVAAALAATWAAFNAMSAARATRDLVELERTREAEKRAEQVKLVTVDLTLRRTGYNQLADKVAFVVSIANDSAGPIRFVRLRVTAAGKEWGPKLYGTVGAGQSIDCSGWIYSDADEADADATIRMVDIHGQSWLVTARGKQILDDTPLDHWIADGKAWVAGEADREAAWASGRP